ncbi:hypothetical protein GCK32_001436 [Trichostrongylus colubriformis]|uniref:HMG box domain-containing protein n=1 Tax=Trichostrongylus colubriformis TaxID=6319 RepID=A0AAN8IWZ7_TRICO
MIVVLLVCLLSKLQAYSRNLQADGLPEFTPESDKLLEQLAKDMFGYSVDELYEHKHNLSHDQYIKMVATWKKVKETEGIPKLFDASQNAINAFYLFDYKVKQPKEEVITTVKRNLSEIWWHLSPEEQKLWKEKFPFAANIEKLANNRHVLVKKL